MQYGGLLVLGVNAFNIATPAALCGLIFRPWLWGKNQRLTRTFLAVFCSILLSALLIAGALRLSDKGVSHAVEKVVASHADRCLSCPAYNRSPGPRLTATVRFHSKKNRINFQVGTAGGAKMQRQAPAPIHRSRHPYRLNLFCSLFRS